MIRRILATLTGILCLSSISHAQLVSGNAFLQGNYLEVGMASCGVYGSSVFAPSGYHTQGSNYLGFVADVDKDGLYGGNNNADSSGVLRYVSVRHGGTLIGGGDELNGISFAGVGSGTVVENIEIVATADDGLEFYGGSVNATNIVVWNNGDDGLDTDMGYTGTISNFVLAGAGGACFELDGPESNATNPGGNHTFRNGTVIASRPDNTKSENLLDYDGDDKGNGRTNVTVENVHFTGVKAGQLINANQKANSILSLSNITVDVDAASLPNYIGANTEATNAAAISVGTVGQADLSKFDGWTWSRTSGAL